VTIFCRLTGKTKEKGDWTANLTADDHFQGEA